MAERVLVVAADSVTRLDEVAGKVLVAGSHGMSVQEFCGVLRRTIRGPMR